MRQFAWSVRSYFLRKIFHNIYILIVIVYETAVILDAVHFSRQKSTSIKWDLFQILGNQADLNVR